MIRNISSLIFLLLCSFGLVAQTVRTDVTVVGGTAGGISAAIQAARSGVKSLVLEERGTLSPEFTLSDLLILQKIRDHYLSKNLTDSAKKNSLSRPVLLPSQAQALVKSMTDTVKKLTVMLNTSIKTIKKDGKGWEIKLQNGKTVKTDVVIDASKGQILATLLKIEPEKTIIQVNNWINSPASAPRLFRTTVASGTMEYSGKSGIYLIPAATLMPVGIENIFFVPASASQLHPQTMLAGQAAGAAAAFCAYFKTTSKNLNIRVTQGELLAYDARLIPYEDINFQDRHAIALQHTGLSGILKARSVVNAGKEAFTFDTLGTVSSQELRQPMREFYSRSQIWFADHQKDSLSIDDVISLLMFTATRGQELRSEIESGWKSSFKFNTSFDPKRAIYRREFAVLTDRYLQPFNRRIDVSGNLLN
jgi:hypothetical protein